MIDALRKIWAFAGSERKNLNRSVLLGVLYAMFHALQIAALQPDLILIDFLMPGQDGAELVRRLREKGCRAKCIMLSQVTQKDMIAREP